MQYRFFKCKKEIDPIATLHRAWTEKQTEITPKLEMIYQSIPFYNGLLRRGNYAVGILCNAKNPALKQAKAEKGYKITRYEQAFLIQPDKRYKAGKLLAKQLEEISAILSECQDFSQFMVKKLNLTCWVLSHDKAYITAAGTCGDWFLAKIPVKTTGYGGDDFPAIPDFLTEIKESEFLAILGK